MIIQPHHPFEDESKPVNPGYSRGYPVVIFGENGFCAGQKSRVQVMPSPHMHSQVEINYVISGSMTYWFDGQELKLSAGRMALFWGMIPHQTTACDPGTEFVVLYVPMSVFLELPQLSNFRNAIFKGAMIEALDIKHYDEAILQRWREDLNSGDAQLESIVRDELTARVRRLDREGWRDLRDLAPQVAMLAGQRHQHDRAVKLERMTRYIAEHAMDDIEAADVAAAADLHPNYAMTFFKQALGISIKQSILRQRLDAAQSMLIGTSTPVSKIAFDCGFGSISSFYAAFEKRFGESPLAFRRALKKAVA